MKKLIIYAVVLFVVAGAFGAWKWNEHKKEQDRQALLHMGDSLKKAFDDYNSAVSEINDNYKLAEEYTSLMASIASGSASNVEEAKKRACKIEKELREIYPTVYTAASSICR